ncbi:MAG: hypothetical protein C3F15_08065 [Holophagae bacterium]|nr:MAG: hypothetical protein C3F15_08065 [Holophagae bacterium]
MERLSSEELVGLIEKAFRPGADDSALAVLIDLPDGALPDRDSWRVRRELAAGWARELAAAGAAHGLEVGIFGYRNVRANNADLPDIAWRIDPDDLPATADDLDVGRALPLLDVLAAHRLIMAPTELSATAPLKRLAPRLGFRAATMPGFTAAMVPALRLDYSEVDRRVRLLKGLLDRAEAADLEFIIDGGRSADLHLDLRHRLAHASSGLLHEPGTAGNLPSGEAYIVPYEGERPGDASRSAGVLPIQLGDEVVVYRIEANQAVAIDSAGVASNAVRRLLAEEPATGNLAELGLGVLAELGVRPIGQLLLDEKLGLHLAFGRSDHFGGAVGPGDFSRPEAVIHQDHVFLPELQPRIVAARVELVMEDGVRLELMRDGIYTVRFDGKA